MSRFVGDCRGLKLCLGSKQASEAIRRPSTENFAATFIQGAGAEQILQQPPQHHEGDHL